MSPERKTWLFLIGITVAESAPFWFRALGRTPAAILRTLGFAAGGRGTAAGWALAVLVALAFIVASARPNPVIRRNLLRLNALKLMAIPMALVSGIVEEVYFRRVLMNVVATRGGSVLAQIALSAVIFGLLHAVWGLAAGSLRVAAGSAAATGLLGAALAAVYVLAGRSMAPCIAAHVAINAVLEPWLFLSAAQAWGAARGGAATPS